MKETTERRERKGKEGGGVGGKMLMSTKKAKKKKSGKNRVVFFSFSTATYQYPPYLHSKNLLRKKLNQISCRERWRACHF